MKFLLLAGLLKKIWPRCPESATMVAARLLSILALLALPAGARPKTVEIRPWSRGQHLHVRVLAYNPTSKWQGPLDLRLECRFWGRGPWLPLRRWKKLGALGPGQKVCRDYFTSAPWQWPQLQLRAQLVSPELTGLDQSLIH